MVFFFLLFFVFSCNQELKAMNARELRQQSLELDSGSQTLFEFNRLIREGKISANSRDKHGKTILMVAAASRDGDRFINQLLGSADVDLKDKCGNNALHYAVTRGRIFQVNRLLVANADVDNCDSLGMTPLMWATINGRTVIVNSLLAAGSDPSIRDDAGKSAYDYATSYRQHEIAQILREHLGDDCRPATNIAQCCQNSFMFLRSFFCR